MTQKLQLLKFSTCTPAAVLPIAPTTIYCDDTAGYVDQTVFFIITRTGDLSIESTVNWETVDGTAIDGTDYSGGLSGIVTFVVDETQKFIPVDLNTQESDQNGLVFYLNLSMPVNAVLGVNGTCYIRG
jgi:hypothetical protein